MNKLSGITEVNVIESIYLIRGKNVMIDRDLADMYGVETRVLNQAVKRNQNRFPSDFMFQLTAAEFKHWKSQIVTSNGEKMGLRKLPYAFTEHGVAMLSSVLRSDTAIDVNIRIIRVFSQIKETVLANKEMLIRLGAVEQKLYQQGDRIQKHDADIQVIFKALKQLLAPAGEAAPRKRIGFKSAD